MEYQIVQHSREEHKDWMELQLGLTASWIRHRGIVRPCPVSEVVKDRVDEGRAGEGRGPRNKGRND